MFVIVTLMMEAQNIDFVVAVIVVIKVEEISLNVLIFTKKKIKLTEMQVKDFEGDVEQEKHCFILLTHCATRARSMEEL